MIFPDMHYIFGVPLNKSIFQVRMSGRTQVPAQIRAGSSFQAEAAIGGEQVALLICQSF
jgi:hypothetical protein